MSAKLVRRVYRYRCYPTSGQADALNRQLAFSCDLYNAALEQRRTLWRDHGTAINHREQSKQLTDLRTTQPDLIPQGMSRSAMQKTLERVNQSFQAFFRRIERAETPGFPRFRSKHRFDTLRAQHGSGCKYTPPTTRVARKALVTWAGVGELKVKAHRSLPDGARITEVQIRRVAGGREWYICVGVVLPIPPPLPATGESVGVDVGITTFAALSSGEKTVGAHSYRRHERRLARLQQEVARCRSGSNRRRKKRDDLARAHARIGRIRRDHAHKTARSLVDRFDIIYVEALNVKSLARSKLAKHVTDQAWGSFTRILADKAC